MTTAQPLLNYRYKILKALAEGGFGKTFLAEDTQMPSKRRCVIKQLKPVSSRPDIAQIVQDRFTREAAVLDTVGKNHNQIPTLYAYFVTAGKFYLVQEWINGAPMQAAAHTVLPADKVWQLLKDLLPAIAHVHSKNVIHRDIKPDNIIIRKADQLPCLIDFGAVKELMSTVIGTAGMAKSSIVIGTAGYMPQEQAAGRPTFSSDLYSLGMTAICVLVGKHPAAIPTDSRTGQLLWQQYAPTIDPDLAQVLTKAIRPYPQNRYRSAAEMLAALTRPALHAAVSPRLTSLPPSALPFPATTEHPTPQLAVAAPSVTTQVQSSSSTPVSPAAFPVRTAAIGTAAFALGAGLLFTVRPKSAFNTPTTATETSTTLAPAESSLESPASAADFISRATLRYQEGRTAQAQQDVDSALAIEPQNIEALSLKGDILANQSRIDWPGAIAAYTQALTVEPANTDLLQKRCTAYQKNNSLDLAEKDCTQIIGLMPNSAATYDQRGDIRSAQENYEDAIADYTQAITLNENKGTPAANQSIYYSRGLAYAAINEDGKGLEDFEKMRTPQ